MGNPGPEYRATWHNLGYRSLEKLAADLKVNFTAGKGEFFYARTKYAGKEIFLLKPTCFMNLSGQPILQVVEREDIFHQNLLVVLDDISLPLGRLRLRPQGSDGGHKGLSSVIYYIGTENFPRLRLGISTGEETTNLRDYVLSEIPLSFEEQVETMLERAVYAMECFVQEGISAAMSKFNLAEEENLQERN